MEALQQPTIRTIAVIAEGVPEGDTKKLIAYAAKNHKIVLGPATVGGLQVCCSPISYSCVCSKATSKISYSCICSKATSVSDYSCGCSVSVTR